MPPSWAPPDIKIMAGESCGSGTYLPWLWPQISATKKTSHWKSRYFKASFGTRKSGGCSVYYSINFWLKYGFHIVINNTSSVSEYASVGYMAKRIQMRKNRFLAIQKMAEQKKNEALHASNANINNDSNNLDLGPKQTVSLPSVLPNLPSK